MSEKSVKRYTRGPYNTKATLYNKSNTSRRETSAEDINRLITEITAFRTRINNEFTISHNRSRVIENLQGLLNMLYKQQRTTVEVRNEEMKIILDKLEQIETRIESLETSTSSWTELDNILNNE